MSSVQPNTIKHVAIIMDGNGRWAEKQHKPRIFGHRAGVEAVRQVVQASQEYQIEALTLFAFSSENWRRPQEEVSLLMELFMLALRKEVKRLHKHNVRLKVIGDVSAFSGRLQKQIASAEALTAENTGLVLNIAANYGGQWDIVNAAKLVAQQVADGELSVAQIDNTVFEKHLALATLPKPDLFIRTGGETRISNFLLWQIAYTELYFTDVLWPDFTRDEYINALHSFSSRIRRFGKTNAQVLTATDSKGV